MPADSMLLRAVLQFDAATAIKDMGRASVSFQRMQSNVNRVRGGMSRFSGAVGRASLALAPLTLGMGMAIHHAHEFERGVAEVATIADEAEFPIRKIEQTTLDLAKTFGTVPVEQTKGLYQAISAGATDAAEATDLLNAANKLAIGGVSDTFTSIDVLTSALNAYEAQGLTATDATDTLFTAVRKGKTTVDELGAGLGQVIPTAAQLDISFADLNASIAAITLSGISTAQATTGLNAALANIIKPSEDAKEAARELGIDFTSTALKSKGLAKFMGDIIDTAGGNEVALSKLFGSIRGVRAMMALTNNEGQILGEVLDAMEGRAGATEAAFQKMAHTTDFQMRKLNSLRVIASTVFGQVLERGLLRIVSPLAGVLEGFVNILEAVKTGEFQGLSDTAAAIAMGIRDGMDAVTEGIGWVVDKIREAKTWFEGTFGGATMRTIAKFGTIFLVAGAALAPIALALGGIGFLLPAIITAVTAIGSIIAGAFGLILGPVGLVIAAVVLFREQLWMVFQGLWDAAVPVIEEIKSIFLDTIQTVVHAFNFFTDEWGQGNFEMQMGWRETGRLIGEVLGWVITKIVQLAAVTVKVAAMIIVGFKSVANFLGTLAGKIVTFVMDPLRSIARGVIGFMELTGMEVPFSLRAYAGGGEAPRAQGRGIGGGQARGIGERVAQFGREEARASAEERVAAEESRGALAGVLDEVKNAANNTADSAASAAAAAKKKPCASVNVDGREVARSNAKAEDEIRARSGGSVTPWQRSQIAVHGARPAR